MVEKLCQSCGKPFVVKAHRAPVAKFCSHQCYWDSNVGVKRGPLSDEVKAKLSRSKMGLRRKMPPWNKGKKLPHLSGKNHWRWLEDRTKLSTLGDPSLDRRCSAYVTWRNEVYKRDGYICKMANAECYGKIEAHHILGFKEHPNLRYDTRNGITLCHFHHPRKRKEEHRLSPLFTEIVSKYYDNIGN